MTTMKKLLQYGAARGITIHAARLEPGIFGEWYEEEREIYFDLTLSPDEQLEAICHEFGHAHHGHRCENNPDAERQADIFAARMLIDPAKYALLERTGMSRHDIADELGLSVRILDVFLKHCLTMMRGVTYARARMGAGQWLHRADVAS